MSVSARPVALRQISKLPWRLWRLKRFLFTTKMDKGRIFVNMSGPLSTRIGVCGGGVWITRKWSSITSLREIAGCKSSLFCQVRTGLTHPFRFRLTACQLEVLRNHSSTIRDALDDLPKGLEETYERILRGIDQAREKDARHLLHCLAAAIRPLCVEELSDILAMKFNAGQPPKYSANRREENPEEEILLACSSLITVINVDYTRLIQFAHSSVKEYLISERLANAPLSHYHILPHSAHTLLAQASLCVLLALDGQVDKESVKNFPLTKYAGRYWIDHVEFGNVTSNIEDAMKCLFDPAKPHFANWVWIYDIDFPFRPIVFAPRPTQPM